MGKQDLERALEAAVPGIKVWDSDRPHPVQVAGTIDGSRFYFRARGRWEFAVAATILDDPAGVSMGLTRGWSHQEEYKSQEHDAGDMPIGDVVACIVKAVGLWRSQKKAAEQDTKAIAEAHD